MHAKNPLLAAAAAALLYMAPVALADNGGVNVSGLVTFDGKPPQRRPIPVDADDYCEDMYADKPLLTEDPIIGSGGEFANIFVWIDNPPAGEYPPPEEPVVLNQHGCRYTTYVFGMMVGQTLQVTNSDQTTHNVRGFPENNRVFNFGQPPGLPPRTRVFDAPEHPLKIKCDVHGWMKSFCFVMEHPFFAVTGEDGRFTIANVPPGTYTLKTWHERLGELEQQITVGNEPAAAADFVYKRPPRKN